MWLGLTVYSEADIAYEHWTTQQAAAVFYRYNNNMKHDTKQMFKGNNFIIFPSGKDYEKSNHRSIIDTTRARCTQSEFDLLQSQSDEWSKKHMEIIEQFSRKDS